MSISRKQFLVGIGAGALAAIVGCGGDDGGSVDAASTGTCMNPATTISANHGHTMVVTIADVNAAANKMYIITGSAGHDHEVDLTADQFAKLRAGQSVTIESSESGNGHSHSVTVSCALV